jgi:DNA-binding MarR family transcriptional regulator
MVSKEKVFQQMVALIASAHQLHYDMTKDMPMNDLTPLQYEILEFLAVEQPLVVSQISECKGISMPNMSREIKKLTEKGLCEKIGDTEDRRKLYIRLTKSGEDRMAEAFEHMRKLFIRRLENIPATELVKISEAMGILDSMILRSE